MERGDVFQFSITPEWKVKEKRFLSSIVATVRFIFFDFVAGNVISEEKICWG